MSRRKVSRRVQQFLKHARAENTIRAYESDMRHFRAWGGRVPASASQVAEYLAELAESTTLATIRRRKAALTAAHRYRGLPSPCESEIVRATIAGIRRTAKKPWRQMRPLLTDQVSTIVKAMPSDLRGVRDKALLMLGFAGALRRSEIAALNVDDCGLRDGSLIVQIRRSKTDQLGQGREVTIPAGAKKSACPIVALRIWIARGGIREGPLFRAVSQRDGVRPARLDAAEISRIVKKRMIAAGLDPAGYGAHSLRAGYVTSAAMRGIPLWHIKRQTGHSRETMVETYVRPLDTLTLPSLF